MIPITGLGRVFWQRVATWAVFFGCLVLLRDLFALFFLAFLFAFAAESIVQRLTRLHPYRRFFTSLVMISFLGILLLLVSFVGPGVYGSALKGVNQYLRASEHAPAGDTVAASSPVSEMGGRLVGHETFARFARTEFYGKVADQAKEILVGVAGRIAGEAGEMVVSGVRFVVYLFIAWILAFVTVWDLPQIREEMRAMERGRFGRFYCEIAPTLVSFAGFIGRAFQAQFVIAIVNTVLSIIGLAVLGIPEIPLLATIVFISSFIPIFGMFLSTLPMALIALQTGGWPSVATVVALIGIIHALEAYVINPVIYGHAFEAHPILTLVLLLLGEHFFGFWGVILAVPVGVYVVQYGLIGRSDGGADVGGGPA